MRSSTSVRVLKVTEWSPGTLLVRSERLPDSVRAGQCFSLGIPGFGINREYSLFSDPNADYFEFLVRVVEDGSLTPNLRKLREGDLIEVNGPFGEFLKNVKPCSGKRMLFVATGTGIAPFHSLLLSGTKVDYLLIHGVRSVSERYGYPDYEKEKYMVCVSGDSSTKYNRVTEALKEVPLVGTEAVFICGNRLMIVDSYNILSERGISASDISTEVFF